MVNKIESVDPARRAALKKLVGGAAYAVPVVASFAMAGLAAPDAYADNANVASVPTVSDWVLPGFALLLGAGGAAYVANKAKKVDDAS